MYPSRPPRKERILLTSSNQAFESPPYDDQALLPQGRQAKGGDILTKETYHKDGKGLPPSKTKPPFFQKVKQKEEEPASSKMLPVYIMLPRKPKGL